MLHRCSYWFLYLAAFLLLAGVALRDFTAARRLARPTPPGMYELVSSRRPLSSTENSETWRFGPTGFRIEGLSNLERDQREPLPWRHGLAPATRLCFEPGHGPVEVRWTFMNPVSGQRLRILLDGKIVGDTAVGQGTHSGQTLIPAHASASVLELEFELARPVEPNGDPRHITVTFTSLQIRFR